MDIYICSLSALSALSQSVMRIEILDFTSNATQLQYFAEYSPIGLRVLGQIRMVQSVDFLTFSNCVTPRVLVEVDAFWDLIASICSERIRNLKDDPKSYMTNY